MAKTPFKNPMSIGKLPGIAKGGPSGVKQPMSGMSPTAKSVPAVPKKMPKKR